MARTIDTNLIQPKRVWLLGLWRLKNIFVLDLGPLVHQMLYAGLFIGPLLGYITWRTKTIWPAVIIPQVNHQFYWCD